jgi:hypothetical protein
MSGLSRPIFVVGCPRSGTTLVQCILSASSQAFSLPETHFFSWVLQVLDLAPSSPVGPEQVRLVKRELESEAELVLPAPFWSSVEARGDQTALDIFLAVVEYHRPAPGVRAVEKTPRHVLHLDTIGSTFPDAAFVNVIRDPIDVASSLLGVPFESSRSVLSHAHRWTESVHAAQTYARSNPGRLMTIIYERLVREPEALVRELCRFVDLPYEPRMLDEFGREAARNIGPGEAWKRTITSGVILDRQGVWRTRMTPGLAWLVAQTTHADRSTFGYSEQPAVSVSSVVAAILRETRVRFSEARASTGIVGAARHAGSVLKTLSTA